MKKVQFNIHYRTAIGESLFIKIKEPETGKVSEEELNYVYESIWRFDKEIEEGDAEYHFLVKNAAGKIVNEEMSRHLLSTYSSFDSYCIFDSWNNKNFPENYLNNKILHNVLKGREFQKIKPEQKESHLFSVQAPLYNKDEKIVLLGSATKLGSWDLDHYIEMYQADNITWEVFVDLSDNIYVEYKYAILNTKTREIVYENGPNRKVRTASNTETLNVLHDHYFKFPVEKLWRVAGVAVPVFSLRSENSFGVGEFADLKLLADWAEQTKLAMLQILPINDTTATHQWTDSYPYAAISVYALHPQYLSLENLTYPLSEVLKEEYESEKKRLNLLSQVDYEAVMSEKLRYLKTIFNENQSDIFTDKDFQNYRIQNSNWLDAYAVFCTLRDIYGTPDFSKWKTLSVYNAEEANRFLGSDHKDYATVIFHIWVQYQLHLQLTAAIDYIHSKGLAIKGDLPIGIYRHSVEAWTEPELFGMDFQAGAPPDEFTDLGQNWEFPTYNWEVMKDNGYQWWKNRFTALSQYFDAMRIDHILGFFRIWRMPASAVQGILGSFYPTIPVTKKELEDKKIGFDHDRYCKPFINAEILQYVLEDAKDEVINTFLIEDKELYHFRPEYNTQRKIESYFKEHDDSLKIKDKLYYLLANVLFLEEETEEGILYHPRFNLSKTFSYQYLEEEIKGKLFGLYINYFFHRQDQMWKGNAMDKLPMLLQATDMLICGEDLGLVPEVVPEVMDHLAILALKVQRSPKENIAFYNPQNAAYLNVVTTSSHDTSTLRQWWKENRVLTQKYYNEQLNQNGKAPEELTPYLAEIIMKQHLNTEAMLAIFPIQEFFATDKDLQNPDENAERINVPAIFPHYWRYRMHIGLEDLLKNKSFNQKIANWVTVSGR
ncbi:TPA: 4-alpha-glucanotransferase [Elizabethkingia anophelis]|nr:4-alpha-glucanotransferase [Elizabethkingia anophelis]